MSNCNYFSNGPQLVWVIEPENKIRFRYESEGGSHGGLAGKAGKKTYPTLKLENYNGRKQIIVKVSLYTEDEKPHVLEFKGKKNEGSKPEIKEVVQDDNTVVFKNIHILSKKKDVIEKELMGRKLRNLKEDVSRAARAQFEKRYAKDVKERARAILNSVRLYFEAFEVDKPDNPLCCLSSEVICNQKAASKGDLRICRLSSVTGSWKGGDEVILLCEKVQKDNIKVKFFETNESGDVVWLEYGSFSPVDVHYQVAIPFKTPRYIRNEEKRVYICLERNDEMSEPREFTYKPDEPSSKKRKLEESETVFFPDTPDSIPNSYPQFPSSPDISNGASGGISSLQSDDSQEINMKCELPFSIEDIEEMNGYFDNIVGGVADFQHPFNALLDLGDFENGSVEFFTTMMNEQIEQDEIDGVVCGQMASASAQMYVHEAKTAQRLDLVDLDVGVKNIKLEDDDEREHNTPNNSIKVESKLPKNSSDLQHRRKICTSLFLRRDRHGNTILHQAVLSNKNIVPLLKMSRVLKIDLMSLRNHKNQTALHIAAEENKCEALRILLQFGSNPNLKDFKGNNCYLVAAISDFPSVLREIIRFSRFPHEVCAFNDEGLTALHVAVMQKNPALFDFLEMHMINPNIAEKKAGKSLLHYAVDFKSVILTKLLDMSNINVNVQDFEGNTPLHIACASANVEVVKKLLQSGADPLVKNFKQNALEENSEDENTNGQLPADLTSNLEILKLLRSATREVIKGSIDVKDPDCFQEEMPCQITEELCKYLDEDEKWKKLAPFFLDEHVMNSLSLSSSPSKALLAFVKKEEQNNYFERLKTALEFAELTDGLSILNQQLML